MKLNKKVLSLALSSMIVISSSMVAYGAPYSDISNHWAKAYIEDMQQKDMIGGYPDGTFAPDKAVSRLESIIMLSKLFDQDKVQRTYRENISKWEEKLNEYKIPDWSWPFMVFALENKIIPSNDSMLSGIMNQNRENVQMNALRYEVAVFMVNAMNWHSQMNRTAVLKYNDASEINPQAIPYIDVLIRNNVISETGDPQGNFGPNRAITRAEMAVMISNVYDKSERATGISNEDIDKEVPEIPPGGGDVPSTGAPVSVNPDNYSVTDGKIDRIIYVGDKINLTVQGKDGMIYSFSNDSQKVDVKIGTKSGVLSDIKMDKNAKIVHEGNNLISVILEESQEKRDGIVTGKLKDIRGSRLIISEDRNDNTYDISSRVLIRRNGVREDSLTSLRTGDSLEVELKDGLIISIEANSVKSSIRKGVIKEIQVGAFENRLVVENSNREDVVVVLSSESLIRVRGERKTIYALEVGFEVDVYLDGDVVEEIITFGTYRETTINGTILSVDDRARIIEVEDALKNVVKISYNSRTNIEDLRYGNFIDPRKLYRGDELIVVGVKTSGQIEATRILVNMKWN